MLHFPILHLLPYLCKVKKACIYILLPLLMFNSSLGELFKIPVLYAHFMEHRSLDHDIDIFDFLSMHYFGDDLNDNDQDRDMELPFKKISDSGAFQLAPPQVSKPVLEKRQFFKPQQFPLPDSQDFNLTDPALDNLFRPPIA